MYQRFETVSLTGADTIAVSIDTTVADDYALFLGYWYSKVDPSGANNQHEVTEYALTLTKSFGPLDTTTALVYDGFRNEVSFVDGDTQDLTSFLVFIQYNF